MKKTLFIFVVALLASFTFAYAQNLTVKSTADSFVLLDKPVEHNPSNAKVGEFELKYINGPLYYGWGNTSTTGTIYASGCISFTESQMLPYEGGTLNSISIGHTSEANMTNLNYNTAKIWIKQTLSGDVLYEQPYIPAPGEWVDVPLTTPYQIGSGSLVIGYTVELDDLVSGQNCYPLGISQSGYVVGAFYYVYSTNSNNYGAGANFGPGNTGCLGVIGYGLADLADKDLSATNITTNLNEFQLAGTEYNYTVTVENIGQQAQNNFTVQIIDETDEVLASENITTPLEPTEIAYFDFPIQKETAGALNIRGKVILEGDEIEANNITDLQTFMLYPMTPIGYCDRTTIKYIYWQGEVESKWYAIRVLKEDIEQYVGKYITQIEVGVNEGDLVQYLLPWIAQGTFAEENSGFPWEDEDLTWYDHSFTPIKTGWNVITLPEPFLIANDNLYIGYDANTLSGFGWGVSRNDINPPNSLHGNWCINGGWINWYDQYDTPGNLALIATIVDQICDAVTNFKAEYMDVEDECKAQLTWDPVEGVSAYTIKRGETVIASNLEATSYIDADFDATQNQTWSIYYDCEGAPSLSATASLGICNTPGINDFVKIEFRIIPNPAKDNIRIIANNDFNKIEVINFLGQTVISSSQIGAQAMLDVSSLNSGIYFVRLTTDNGTNVQKFVKK